MVMALGTCFCVKNFRFFVKSSENSCMSPTICITYISAIRFGLDFGKSIVRTGKMQVKPNLYPFASGYVRYDNILTRKSRGYNCWYYAK